MQRNTQYRRSKPLDFHRILLCLRGEILADLAQLDGKLVIVFTHAIEVHTPAYRHLGVVDRLLDLLISGSKQLGRLRVEEGAVAALSLGVDRHSHKLLVLVGSEGFAQLHLLEELPLGIKKSVRNPAKEAGN